MNSFWDKEDLILLQLTRIVNGKCFFIYKFNFQSENLVSIQAVKGQTNQGPKTFSTRKSYTQNLLLDKQHHLDMLLIHLSAPSLQRYMYFSFVDSYIDFKFLTMDASHNLK